MIEILIGVYYDHSKEWYEQPTELIQLATETMQNPPIGIEYETNGDHERMLWGEWEARTECGTFTMRVDREYVYGIGTGAFLGQKKSDIITITKG